MSFMLLGILNSQAAGGVDSSFDLLATTTLNSSSASVTLSNLTSYAADYKHLQIRFTARTNYASWNDNLRIRINGATSGYTYHYMEGTGGNVQSSRNLNQSFFTLETGIAGDRGGDEFSSTVLDVLDFASNNKKTTIKSFGQVVSSVGSRVNIHSLLYNTTSAVDTMLFYPSNGTAFTANSRFSIYGVK
jgi:hypothetical protein